MKQTRYRQIYNELKSGIQQGRYMVDSYLPSENDLCATWQITRTTARRALDELQKEGFIERQHGKGSRVKERRQSLGLLTVKGFSEAVGQNVNTIFFKNPHIVSWPGILPFATEEAELQQPCIHFERVRMVGDMPVILEQDWLSATNLPGFVGLEFEEGSFFKTLSRKYLIEITSSEQELRALPADTRSAKLLNIRPGAPLLRISLRFTTSKPGLNIYSYLYCNTELYPIGNTYTH